MQGNQGFRADERIPGIVYQVFDGCLVVEDHLGFQGILALGSLSEFDQPFSIELAISVAFQ